MNERMTVTDRSRIKALIHNTSADRSFQRRFYEDIHANPELSGMERRTAEKIKERLSHFDCEIISGIGGHGLVGIFRNGDGPTVLMRADTDALPVKERSGLPFASRITQARADGTTVPVMHACGHDMHTTALLGVSSILDAERASWSGTFIALFQPAEENSTGADAMLADGLAQHIPHPDVCLGQHIMPGRAGDVMSKRGPIMASCDSIKITITGRSAHGSMPHVAIDPSFVAAMIVVRLQGIVGREVDPADFAVISVGSMRSGDTNNIIPGTAELVLNCRTYDNAVKTRVYEAIHRVAHAECEAQRCPEPPEFDYFAHGELVDNDGGVFDTVRPVFDEVFGELSIDTRPNAASEDFSHLPMGLGCPYMFWFIGLTPAPLWDRAVAEDTVSSTVPVNHTPTFVPDFEPTVRSATDAGAAACLAYLAC